eukprot:TRINITY_DN568_c0_g1_i1.p1 TRINITY_DN568_c0_g1~~TRINITY_DN568_c0_g1_i1.p1  ORF type:complete len:121 (-),score=18.68 TRINITY_DN568_c0_g1_i1:78-440(-)
MRALSFAHSFMWAFYAVPGAHSLLQTEYGGLQQAGLQKGEVGAEWSGFDRGLSDSGGDGFDWGLSDSNGGDGFDWGLGGGNGGGKGRGKGRPTGKYRGLISTQANWRCNLKTYKCYRFVN